MTQLAEQKGYRLVAQELCNAIFVRQKYFPLFHRQKLKLINVFTNSGIFYTFSGGKKLKSGMRRLLNRFFAVL